jgi:hypothetical protein
MINETHLAAATPSLDNTARSAKAVGGAGFILSTSGRIRS